MLEVKTKLTNLTRGAYLRNIFFTYLTKGLNSEIAINKNILDNRNYIFANYYKCWIKQLINYDYYSALIVRITY